MTSNEIIIGLVIHIVIPLVGIGVYWKIFRKMEDENIHDPPNIALFFLFSTYGSLILVMLTQFFWVWSGMASLGTFYLILGAPIMMGIIAKKYFKLKGISRYHYHTWLASISYFIIFPLFIVIILFIDSIS